MHAFPIPFHPGSLLQLLFTVLALVMAGVRTTSDKRDRQIHHGSWIIKAGLWLVAMVFPFFLPPSIITAYCACACGWGRGAGAPGVLALCWGHIRSLLRRPLFPRIEHPPIPKINPSCSLAGAVWLAAVPPGAAGDRG